MARQRQRQRRRVRLAAGALLAALAAPSAAPLGFAVQASAQRVALPQRAAPQPGRALALGRATAAPGAARRRPGRDLRPRTARRIFDTGSLFGIGLPEATVIALLGWFLLGPEELYRLAKQTGNYLGELRGFVGQAAQQYESALDDDSTRKAIEGIRNTQRTVSEISDSWRSVTDSLRNPLALSSTLGSGLDAAVSKLEERQAGKGDKKDNGTEPAKAPAEAAGKAAGKAGDLPDLVATEDPEALTTVEGKASKELGPSTGAAGKLEEEEETPEELERKKAASRQAVADLWYKKAPSAEEMPITSSSEAAEAFARKLDERLGELDDLASQLQELREGILEDRQGLQKVLQATTAEESSKAIAQEKPQKAIAQEKPQKAPATVPAGGVEAK